MGLKKKIIFERTQTKNNDPIKTQIDANILNFNATSSFKIALI